MEQLRDFEPGDDDLPLGPHPLAFVAVLAGVVFLAYLSTSFFFAQVGAASLDGGTELVEVPGVVGADRASGVAQLEAAGFTVRVETAQNTRAPVGQIVDQRPRPGTRIDSSTPVTVTISAGDGFAVVPDVRGSQLDEMQLLLFVHGLAMGDVGHEDSDAAADEVIGQYPAPGETVPLGTPIHLMISSGPPIVEIPDVSGMSALEAGRALRDAGFDVIYEDRYAFSVSRGDAVATEPEGEAPRGSRVVLQVSLGRAPTRATAPPPPPVEGPSPTTAPAPPSTIARGLESFAPYEH